MYEKPKKIKSEDENLATPPKNSSMQEWTHFPPFVAVSALGQDHHRWFEPIQHSARSTKEEGDLVLAGVRIAGMPKLLANSDGDVVLHALCNAISGLSGKNILGFVADELCSQGVTDSRVYVKEALATLGDHYKLTHVSISIEAKKPKLKDYLPLFRRSLAELLGLQAQDVGITATTGEGLTGMGKGEGIGVLCIVSALKRLSS